LPGPVGARSSSDGILKNFESITSMAHNSQVSFCGKIVEVSDVISSAQNIRRIIRMQDTNGMIIELVAWGDPDAITWSHEVGTILTVVNGRVNTNFRFNIAKTNKTRISVCNQESIEAMGVWTQPKPAGILFEMHEIETGSIRVYPTCQLRTCKQVSLPPMTGSEIIGKFRCEGCGAEYRLWETKMGVCLTFRGVEYEESGTKRGITKQMFRNSIAFSSIYTDFDWTVGNGDLLSEAERVSTKIMVKFVKSLPFKFRGENSQSKDAVAFLTRVQ